MDSVASGGIEAVGDSNRFATIFPDNGNNDDLSIERLPALFGKYVFNKYDHTASIEKHLHGPPCSVNGGGDEARAGSAAVLAIYSGLG
jgi:hypothetical protein